MPLLGSFVGVGHWGESLRQSEELQMKLTAALARLNSVEEFRTVQRDLISRFCDCPEPKIWLQDKPRPGGPIICKALLEFVKLADVSMKPYPWDVSQ